MDDIIIEITSRVLSPFMTDIDDCNIYMIEEGDYVDSAVHVIKTGYEELAFEVIAEGSQTEDGLWVGVQCRDSEMPWMDRDLLEVLGYEKSYGQTIRDIEMCTVWLHRHPFEDPDCIDKTISDLKKCISFIVQNRGLTDYSSEYEHYDE